MSSQPNTRLLSQACRCGPPPEACVTDDTPLTQHAWKPTGFRTQPRVEYEVDISLLRGNDWTAESASRYILRGEDPDQRKLRRVALRQTTAGQLRAAGFGVVHTPGRFRNGPHVSVVYPDSRPLEEHTIPWPPEVSERFVACFAGHEEGEVTEDES